MVKCHDGGTACDRGARGCGISKVFMEEVAFERSLERWIQLQQADLMCVLMGFVV